MEKRKPQDHQEKWENVFHKWCSD